LYGETVTADISLHMSRFLKLDRLDPYRLFGSVLRRSRLGMKAAFDEAFAAHARCSELLKRHQWLSFDESRDVFAAFRHSRNGRKPTATPGDLEQMYPDAQAEDLQADYQASIVVLFADDALQHFAKGLFGKKHRGFIPVSARNTVACLSLLSFVQAPMRCGTCRNGRTAHCPSRIPTY
jgi:hypothetical protein